MSRQDKGRKTITRSFRISKEWERVLEEKAENQGLSVNVLMNRILRRYALFGRWTDHTRAHDSTTLTQRALGEILKAASEPNLAAAGAESGYLDIVDVLDVMGLSRNYDSFVHLMEEHFSEFARWFRCFRHSQGREDLFHLQHNLGRRWSIYLEKYFSAYLKSLDTIEFGTEIFDNVVNLKVTMLDRSSHSSNN